VHAQGQQECLATSERMYRDLVEMAHEGITMVDPDDNLTFVNRQFARSLGYKASELVGNSVCEFATKASAIKMRDGTKLRRKGLKSRYEVTFYHRDGSQKYFWLSASPIYSPSGEFIGSMGVYSDVTEKKMMELRLKRKVRQIDTLYKVYGHARMVKPLNSVLNGVAQAVCHPFSKHDLVQSRLLFDGKTYTYPKKIKRFACKIEIPLIIMGVKRGILQVGYNKKIPGLDGAKIEKEQGKLVTNVADILCKHMYARALLNRHQEIIKKSFTSIIIAHDRRIMYVNPRFCRMFRCKENNVIGRKVQRFLPFCNTQFGSDGKVRESSGRRQNGENFDVAMITQRIDYQGKPSVLIRVNDISALKKAQKKLSGFNRELKKTVKEKTVHLEEANKRLQSLNQLKDEFIAITSHELRSPLTSIRGYLSFLVDEEASESISEPYRDYLMRAYHTTDSLNYLINNILDVSRLGIGKLELQKVETDIVKLVQSIIDSLSFQANERRLQLEFQNELEEGQVMVSVDSIRMTQVFRNILDNSIKFTKRGKRIKVTICSRSKSKEVCIAVADQGVGIPKASLTQIFDKFMQVKNTHTKYKGGVGLGLFIAKQIVELHGGQIRAFKNEDGGTTVAVHLPINQ